MSNSSGTTSRRRFLTMVGAAGASATLLHSMTGMAPAHAAPVRTGPELLPPGSGKGRKVLILGAGIAGLTAAYELNRSGYEVVVLEAQKRAGGRSFTARKGDVVTEIQNNKRVEQQCKFDEGLYLNLGPGRLPYHHRRVLRYCQELGVALEPYVMETTANLVRAKGTLGTRPYRQVANDTRGRIAELLAWAINKDAIPDLGGPDKEAALKLLTVFGQLHDKKGSPNMYKYLGSTRSGCAKPLTMRDRCEAPKPLTLKELLDSDFWYATKCYQPVDYLWQATMFQPVGGMDMIVKGFVNKIGKLIRYGAEVTEIEVAKDNKSVDVVWQEGGRSYRKTADYCLSNIPAPVLAGIKTNLTDPYKAAVKAVPFEPACKVGWQANSRFWESDSYEIYGGISWIAHNITQFWYPSYDYFTEKGTLTGAYNFEDDARLLGKMSPAERLPFAKKGAAALHPEILDDTIVPTELGISIAWQNVPFQRGGFAHWKDDDTHRPIYRKLLSPDRDRFHMIGDQVSPLDGWQEGAIMSAHHAVLQVAGLVPRTEAAVAHAPDSRSLTQGYRLPES